MFFTLITGLSNTCWYFSVEKLTIPKLPPVYMLIGMCVNLMFLLFGCYDILMRLIYIFLLLYINHQRVLLKSYIKMVLNIDGFIYQI